MSSWTRFLSLCVAVLALGGCAHPISLSGDVSTVVGRGSKKVDKSAGLYIPADLMAREVISAGGGGDKVSYFPYRDMETGLYAAMSETFASVSRINGRDDPRVAADRLDYVFTPTISTTSHSPSLFTWPPTIFTIIVEGRIDDPKGQLVANVRAAGDGRAEFDEFKENPSLSAKRAAESVLRELVKALDAVKDKLR